MSQESATAGTKDRKWFNKEIIIAMFPIRV